MWKMHQVLVLGVLSVLSDSVTARTQICRDNPGESNCRIISCGASGRDGTPGTNGKDGKDGERGEAGPEGPQGPPGPKGDSDAEVTETIKLQISNLSGQVSDLKTSLEYVKKVISALMNLKGVARRGDKFYSSNGKTGSYDEALAICTKAGGSLATPRDVKENEILSSIIRQYGGSAFLGINDMEVEGTFRYQSGGIISYSNFEMPPDNSGGYENCVELWGNGIWNDRNCWVKLLVLCEF